MIDPTGAGPDNAVSYIASTVSLPERRVRSLKHGATFGVFDSFGDLPGEEGAPEGLYHADTRHLSRFELLVNGSRPMLLSSTVQDDNAVLTSDLTNPDLMEGQRIALERGRVHLLRTKFLWDGVSHERVALRNYGPDRCSLTVGFRFTSDFADLFEVRGDRRARHGVLHDAKVAADRVTLSYTGLDHLTRLTTLRFSPPPNGIRVNGADYLLQLPPGGRTVIHVTVSCSETVQAEREPPAFFRALHATRRAARKRIAGGARIETSSATFDELLRRSTADLAMLTTETVHGPYPFAGIPWFSTVFGRDGILTAFQMLWSDPALARGVLRYLAAQQATSVDPIADAEPGKILHETRGGEMARLGEVPFAHYYGSVDSTPLFVMLAGAYLDRTGDLETIRTLRPNIVAALDWIDRFGDRDGDGFVEYGRRNERGLINQGWKDSHDSVFHTDGRIADGPIALCEVQAYTYAAKRAAARIMRLLGADADSIALDSEAETLRQRFEAAFWLPEIGTYALALDGAKEPCAIRTSNAGHVLLGGLAAPERAASVARGLLDRDGFSGWGVRTLAATEARYNPMSYHNGSIWPHDNALVALGLARYGLKAPVIRIIEAMHATANYMDQRRLPELFCGFPRRHTRGPTLYPVACAPQAWAAATPMALLQACLGLTIDAAAREIRFDTPRLPDFLREVRVSNLRVGDAAIDLAMDRHGDDVVVSVVERRGDVRVVTNK